MIFAYTFLAVALTYAMFHNKQVMLGFPSAIFWALLGGHSYTLSTVTWDMYYFLFFASMGMTIFSLVAMYALRSKDLAGPDADKGAFIDERGRGDEIGYTEEEQGDSLDPSLEDEVEPSMSKHTAAVRDRAKKRRESAGRKAKWKEFG